MSQDYRPLITVVGSEVGTHTTPIDYKAGDTVQSERVAGLEPVQGGLVGVDSGQWAASTALTLEPA
jgi:hypothetical protein